MERQVGEKSGCGRQPPAGLHRVSHGTFRHKETCCGRIVIVQSQNCAQPGECVSRFVWRTSGH